MDMKLSIAIAGMYRWFLLQALSYGSL